MKNYSRILLFIGLFSIMSCSIAKQDDYLDCIDQLECRTSSFVSESMVKCFLDKNSVGTKQQEGPGDYSITAHTDNAGDTLLYIVNYRNAGGWKLLSADSRTPAILAQGDKGYFDPDACDGSTAIWLDIVSTHMRRIRAASDERLSFSPEEIEWNKAVWQAEKEQTRYEPLGHWVVTTTTSVECYDSITHLTPNWAQRVPYNQHCPYKSDMSARTRAGCVAIAGAETLYYLHSRFGLPETMPSAGYSVGTFANDTYFFYNYTSDVWDDMSFDFTNVSYYYDLPEALMIGLIGRKVQMNYWDDYSWALPSNLKTEVFEDYGYNCSSGSYDEDIVVESLQDSIPVIVTASDLLIPVNGNIHSFVIDAYQRSRIVYTHLHHWVPADPGIIPPPRDYTDYYTYTYSSPYISAIKINWGWGQYGNYAINDGWYALTANWYVQPDNEPGFTYNYYVSMIYGFEVGNAD